MTSLAPQIVPLEPVVLEHVIDDFVEAVRSMPMPPGTERRWIHLVETEAYDADVIAWPPGTALGLHDHGGSSAAVRVVVGALEERHYEAGRPDELRERRLLAGDGITFGSDHVHAIANNGAVEAVSIHVYSPPLRHMSYYD